MPDGRTGFDAGFSTVAYMPIATALIQIRAQVPVRDRWATLEVRGQGSLAALASDLHDLDGIIDVRAGNAHELSY